MDYGRKFHWTSVNIYLEGGVAREKITYFARISGFPQVCNVKFSQGNQGRRYLVEKVCNREDMQ